MACQYPCGPVANADHQPYEWRPGYKPSHEAEYRQQVKDAEKEWQDMHDPPIPTDKKSLKYLRYKLRSAAVFLSGIDIDTLFRHYDLDNNGILDVHEFEAALRSDCDISEAEVSSAEVQQIFDSIDIDLSGEIDAAEFKAWLDDQELNPYLKVYERAVTIANADGEPHPKKFRDPRSHNWISKVRT